MNDWESIVQRHGPMVFGTAWRILGHAADTEDVVQEVFLEAHRLNRVDPVRHWPGFLRRLATCRALDRLRRRRLCLPLDGLALAGTDDEPDEAAMGRELAERLGEAIAQLPEREAVVFCQRYFDDLSYQEIADNLSISPGAVATALHKARAKLEHALTGVLKGE